MVTLLKVLNNTTETQAYNVLMEYPVEIPIRETSLSWGSQKWPRQAVGVILLGQPGGHMNFLPGSAHTYLLLQAGPSQYHTPAGAQYPNGFLYPPRTELYPQEGRMSIGTS